MVGKENDFLCLLLGILLLVPLGRLKILLTLATGLCKLNQRGIETRGILFYTVLQWRAPYSKLSYSGGEVNDLQVRSMVD